jgi:Protein of unknown function (DUF1573)
MRKYVLFLLFIGMYNCKNEDKKVDTDNILQEIRVDDRLKNEDIIRNPITADAPMDTTDLPVFSFTEKEYNFGEINEGEIIKHVFKFKNIGKKALVIDNVQSTCGCTIPKWNKKAILPDESDEIQVEFNSKGKENQQSKPVTIFANTYPSKTVLYLIGKVKTKNK